MCYQQFASHAYCWASFQDGFAAGKGFLLVALSATSSYKPCTKLTLHCNQTSGHLKMENTENLFLLRCYLEDWHRGPAVSMRSELLVEHEKLGQLPLLTVYVLPV
jgi:hypothetical protein